MSRDVRRPPGLRHEEPTRAFRRGDLEQIAAPDLILLARVGSGAKSRVAPDALRQGDLDGLCGIYAIINAYRAVCPAIDEASSRALFKRLINRLSQCVSPARYVASVHTGLTTSALKCLLAVASAFVTRRHGVQIKASPLTGRGGLMPRKRWSLGQFWNVLGRHFDAGSVAILGLGGHYRHWTVAVRCTPHQLNLLDSDGLTGLRRRQCTVGRRAAGRVSIEPRYVLIVSKAPVIVEVPALNGRSRRPSRNAR